MKSTITSYSRSKQASIKTNSKMQCLKAAAHRARCDALPPLRSRLRQLLRLPMHTAAIFLRKNRATRAMRFQRPIALTTHTECD